MIASLKKYYKPVSRILYPDTARQREVIIYLAVTLLQQSCCLPFPVFRPDNNRNENINEQLILPANEKSLAWQTRIYVALQHTRFTHRNNYLLPS